MKKYRILYRNDLLNTYGIFFVLAECTQDANDYFFKHKSGIILRTDFVEWAH